MSESPCDGYVRKIMFAENGASDTIKKAAVNAILNSRFCQKNVEAKKQIQKQNTVAKKFSYFCGYVKNAVEQDMLYNKVMNALNGVKKGGCVLNLEQMIVIAKIILIVLVIIFTGPWVLEVAKRVVWSLKPL